MKPNETFPKSKKKYAVVMVLCLLFGGFSLISFLSHVYTIFWVKDVVGVPLPRERFDDNNRFPRFDVNSPNPVAGLNNTAENPIGRIIAPNELFYLFGGIISILAGIAIWNLIREKEIKLIKQETADNLLLPDEKAIIHFLKKNSYESTQARLVKETGFNKVQVHRAIKRLESKGVLEKHEYGLTNKIILKKELVG